MSETIKSKVLWSGIGALIVSMVTDLYNFAKISVTSQSIPIFIPIVFAIIGFGLIVYYFWRSNSNEKKRELKEFDDASDIKDPKGKRERNGSYSHAGST